MGNYLNIGNAGFQAIRKGLYVDKSEMIAFVNDILGTKDKLICISRPRRFGKSYAAQMLCAYYDRSCDSASLFADLKIASDPGFRTHLNRYDVICLDMTLMISITEDVKKVVANLQKAVISEVREAYPTVKQTDSLIETLANVSEVTGNRFIVIIDEWDALFREAKNDVETQKSYIQFLRGMFKSPLTDKAIEGAYMTGILPIKKYGTQSAMTDFREYTMLKPGPLAQYIGFTEPEVRALCSRYGMDFEEAKRWYDGYSFPGVGSVYSPNSIISAIQMGGFDCYWSQTESYDALKVYIEMDEDGLQEAIVQMMGGARCRVDSLTFQNDMTSIRSRDDVLTLLIHLGYLAYDAQCKSAYLPNEEIRQMFVSTLRIGKHKEVARLVADSDLLLQSTLLMDETAVAEAIQRAHSAGTAPTFYNNEQALRSVIRFAYLSCVDEY